MYTYHTCIYILYIYMYIYHTYIYIYYIYIYICIYICIYINICKLNRYRYIDIDK